MTGACTGGTNTASGTITVHETSSSIAVQTSCNSYTWNGDTYTASGAYTAQLTNVDGCDSTATLNLTLNYSPQDPVISLTNDSLLSTLQQTGCDYQWINCDGFTPISSQTSYTFTAQEDNSYAVIVTNSCGADTSACVDVDLSSISEIANESVVIYPNPTRAIIKVHVSANLIGKAFLLHDYYGRVIYKGNVTLTDEEINMKDLARGMYFLSIEDYPKIERIIKQ